MKLCGGDKPADLAKWLCNQAKHHNRDGEDQNDDYPIIGLRQY